MSKVVLGILAHVDAGKTTLSESMLYLSGKIRRMGRVDNKDAYLDTYDLEKARGITIFSKQAVFNIGGKEVTLMDTPGHVDFSAEMERTLQVLDYAILVLSGADGIQGHTRTLWRLLEIYEIPTILFVNKMDQSGTDKERLMSSLKLEFGEHCVDFTEEGTELFFDQVAVCDDEVMEGYLESGEINLAKMKTLVQHRKLFPVFFGSALKMEGVDAFMEGLDRLTLSPEYPSDFGARVFKISRDEQNNRLTHLKVTGGTLRVKDSLETKLGTEKINQIRIYSGEKYEAVSEVAAGTMCTVTGLNNTKPGEGFGVERETTEPVLEPVLSYKVMFPDGEDQRLMFSKFKLIEEEEPELRFIWDEKFKEIKVQIMGEVQLEILQSLVQERFDVNIEYGEGGIVYRETIEGISEGVGHFEPLRHYAEVHLILEPGAPGSGLQFESQCSEDVLDRNWQRLVLTHLGEKPHKGVLIGSDITDVKITLVSGRAHNKHTEGGDFREATYRAVRQGLMENKSILLEPYYAFELELPETLVGRAMTDVETMHGSSEIIKTDGKTAVLAGTAPVATMRNYHKEVVAYTRGEGRLFMTMKGYDLCHNAESVIEESQYDPEIDFDNPVGSVFCSKGVGYSVPWYEVKQHMHMEGILKTNHVMLDETPSANQRQYEETWISQEEIEQIINSTYRSNQGKKETWKRSKSARETFYDTVPRRPKQTDETYLLVDGYNIIFAWEELAELAKQNMDSARTKLMDDLSNYQGIKKINVIVVFDAYRVEGRKAEMETYHNLKMVFTGEAQTADHYIEKFAHANQNKYRIIVATSDGLQQMIIRGAGSELLSARELREEVEAVNAKIREIYMKRSETAGTSLANTLSESDKQKMDALIK